MPRSPLTEARRWPIWLAAVVAAALALLWAGVVWENQRLAREQGQHYAAERQVVTALCHLANIARELGRKLRRELHGHLPARVVPFRSVAFAAHSVPPSPPSTSGPAPSTSRRCASRPRSPTASAW